MDFHQRDLLSALCAATPEDYDRAGFGIIAMNLDGIVTHYNTWESTLSGLRPEYVLGKHFFQDVAPCTNNYIVSLRFEEDDLDEPVDYTFTYKIKPTRVHLRLLKSTIRKRQFLVVERATDY